MLRSITYYIYIACIIFFFFGNIGDLTVGAPTHDDEYYGSKYSDDKEVIMRVALTQLAFDYEKNSFGTYPIGFYKEVILDVDEIGELEAILEKSTGIAIEDIQEMLREYWDNFNVITDENGYQVVVEGIEFDLYPVDGLSYETFQEYMDEVDDLLGGGSRYCADRVHQLASEPLTYEEALLEYENVIEKDQISNAYARLFCDYVGISLGILPVFLAVTRCLRDKRAKAKEVIYSKSVSSAKIILPRYLATVLMAILPVFVMAISPTLQCLYYGNSIGAKVDGLAFVTHIIGWLLPSILFSVGIGFFFTELTESPLAILIQGVWWIASIFMPMSYGLVGYVRWNLIPRFNTVGSHDIFQRELHQLIANRLAYTFLGLMLVVATIIIYHIKRRGRLTLHGKVFWRSKNKPEA